MKRFEERRTDLNNAVNRLEEASREIYNDIKNCYILELKKLVEKFNSITLMEE